MVSNWRVILVDIFFILAHFLFFFGVAFYLIGFFKAVVLYIVISMQIGFYFGFVFIPNHVGMDIISGEEKKSFIEKQVVTSRNIKSGWLLNIASGGLNYQIEHHLFPTMSRKHLPKAKPIIKAFCIIKELPYMDATLRKAWTDVFSYLNEVGKCAKRLPIFRTAEDMV